MSCFLNSPTFVEYRTSPQQKAKSRQAAFDKKYGSPKLNLLRQKCRNRAKAERNNNYTSGRRLFGDQANIQKIILEELAELDMKLEEEILKEILLNVDIWLAETVEEEENYLQSSENSSRDVFCPICQKLILEPSSIEPSVLTCKCGIRFHFSGSLSDFQQKIDGVVTNHGANCDANVYFFIEPKGQVLVLNTFCEQCDFFQSIC
ncbi:unnamed protein product [Hermetia illucens]|uniref:RPA-interacting protein C-terminal domain-containing protein n=1 Tax=Hermetia illucens TaxID=343691 RepID=A0A7R8UUH0_HERIL|nr:RIP-like protein [Hermetia illucens]CAD7086198.1 unnamed protein product [Hermetia illucens]